ncbi:ABC transporter ATP-binding protein/permease [Frankia sp. R82]|uniref:ABC transporter ATP-binding protein/permease n=1 Tax=Frankia sp. R82 TaxID=2950553 RepID=UPI002043ACF7|nr:ABC transporter ATP-binding protein/permease [Frankia sp. R82]MCM3884479.1 ABC transporter ATP-binding protein/permease [Frankia sp. R82]
MHNDSLGSPAGGGTGAAAAISATPALQAVDVRIRRGTRRRGRGGHEVIHGLSFTIATGCVVGVIGPSGSGKTTLLRAIVGVQSAVAGDLRVLGHASGDACLRRRVGYATQSASVYGDLTVLENLRYLAEIMRAGIPDDPAWSPGYLDGLLAQVGLTEQANQLVEQLSGGQRSRVSLAAAMIGGTDVLVLDEPTVGADPLLRRRLWADLRRLARGGMTILVSSHVMDEAARCDHLLLLYAGRLLAQGTPSDLLATTGCNDLEEGFVRLLERSEAPVPAATPTTPTFRASTDGTGRTSAAGPTTHRMPPVRTGAARRAGPTGGTHPRGISSCPARRPVDVRRTAATAGRVLRQLGRDRRTLVLVLLLPPALLVTLRLLFHHSPATFGRIGPALLGIFPLMTMFFVTSVAMLRERTSGTLERLMTTPVGRDDLLLGYGVAFAVPAAAQAALATALTVGPLGLNIRGSASMLFLAAILSSLLGTSLGLWMSAFARTEFEAVQFIPAALIPQFMLCGVLVPRHTMLPALDTLSALMPMTYVVDSMAQLSHSHAFNARLALDLTIVICCTLAAVSLAAVTLRRRHP